MTNGIIENPFDYNTKPYDEFNEIIQSIGPNVESCKDKAGKVLKVRSDGSGTYWGSGGGTGTDDYNDLSNKPQVNSITLQGNKTLYELGIQPKNMGTSYADMVVFTDSTGEIGAKSFSTFNYEEMSNLPKINGVTLTGNLTPTNIGCVPNKWATTEADKYLAIDTNGNVITKSGSTTTVAFADITGQPDDNANLKTVLEKKIDKDPSSQNCTFGADASGNVYINLI